MVEYTINRYCASVENIEDIKDEFMPRAKITFKIKECIHTATYNVVTRCFGEDVDAPKTDYTFTLKPGKCITAEEALEKNLEFELKSSQFVLIDVWDNTVRHVYLEDFSKIRPGKHINYEGNSYWQLPL